MDLCITMVSGNHQLLPDFMMKIAKSTKTDNGYLHMMAWNVTLRYYPSVLAFKGQLYPALS